MKDDKLVWDTLLEAIGNKIGVAAIMGNLFAESCIDSTNLQNSYEGRYGTDAQYTQRVDEGVYSREKFAHDSAGYGLAQWTHWSRKAALWDYLKAAPGGRSIGDLRGQLNFLLKELRGYKSVWDAVTTGTDLETVTGIVLRQYERPANQSDANVRHRTAYAKEYLEEYGSKAQDGERDKVKEALEHLDEVRRILEGLC
jgi:hypothetical protein